MSDKKPLKRILILVSGFAFVGSTLFVIAASLFGGGQQNHQTGDNYSNPEAVEQQLAEIEKGYQSVLQREPDNQTALMGLVEVRLQMNNIAGVIESLEKLIELNPQETRFLEMQAALRIQTNDLEGAIATLEKLAQLDPKNYQTLLEEVKQQASKASETPEGEGSQGTEVDSEELEAEPEN